MKADKDSDAYKLGQKAGAVLLIVVMAAAVIWFIVWGIGRLMPDPLTNKQIIEQTKECTDAGMKPSQIINGLTFDVIKVVCSNKDDK